MRCLSGAFAAWAAFSACGGEPDASARTRAAGESAAPTAKETAGKDEVSQLSAELESLEARAREALDAKNIAEANRLVERGAALAIGGDASIEIARGRFVLLRGNIARDAGRTIDARRDYADAMALFRVRDEDRGRFEVFLAEAELEEIQGDYAAAERQLAEAEALLPKIESALSRDRRASGASPPLSSAEARRRSVSACSFFAPAAENSFTASTNRVHASA